MIIDYINVILDILMKIGIGQDILLIVLIVLLAILIVKYYCDIEINSTREFLMRGTNN
jgi:hypothetical protein